MNISFLGLEKLSSCSHSFLWAIISLHSEALSDQLCSFWLNLSRECSPVHFTLHATSTVLDSFLSPDFFLFLSVICGFHFVVNFPSWKHLLTVAFDSDTPTVQPQELLDLFRCGEADLINYGNNSVIIHFSFLSDLLVSLSWSGYSLFISNTQITDVASPKVFAVSLIYSLYCFFTPQRPKASLTSRSRKSCWSSNNKIFLKCFLNHH